MVDSTRIHTSEKGKTSASKLIKLSIITSFASICGVAIWQWLIYNRDLLPDPESTSGRDLANEYLGTLYDGFLVVFAGTVIFLVIRVAKARNIEDLDNPKTGRYIGTRFISFVKNNPIVTVIFAAYTVALVQEATWFHGELVGWIQDAFRDNLLNNFSIRYDFVYETMRRTDYRLFPLSHQDLHVYSWFTPYVKVMMIISAIQLFTIVICGKRLAEKISSSNINVSLLFISAILILFSASIANAFFQLDYPGRMLTFLLAIYSLSYFHYLNHRDMASCYITFLIALIGVYWKDTGFILFVLPAAVVIGCNFVPIPNNFGIFEEKSLNPIKDWQKFYERYRLELWLCWLFSAFCLSYIFISLLPSTYLESNAYGSNNEFNAFAPLIRFWILIVLASIRYGAIFIGRKSIDLLDALNVSALLYVIALYILVGYKSYSYQYAPVEFITVVNILSLWLFISSRISKRFTNQVLIGAVGISSALLLIGYEHLDKRTSFYGHVSRVHELHNSWERTYEAIDKMTRQLKKENKEVNILFTTESWFNKSRHLDRLRYDRLVEWNKGDHVFRIKDGIGEGSYYKPQPGDIYINIDRNDKILPNISGYRYEKVYQFEHNHTRLRNGQIYKVYPNK